MKPQIPAAKRFTAGDIKVLTQIIDASAMAPVESDDESQRDHQRNIILARRVLAKIKQRKSEKK